MTRHPETRRTKKRMNKAGFSIIEMLVALVILGVALTSVLPVFINYANTNRRTAIRAEAVSAAERVMDGLRQRSFNQWGDFERTMERDGVQVATGDPNDPTDNGRTYQVAMEWCNQPTTGLSLCDANGQQRHVRVNICLDARLQYSVTTVFTSVQTNNQAAQGVQGGQRQGSCR